MKRLIPILFLLLVIKAQAQITFVNAASAQNGTANCAPTISVTSGNTVIAIMSTTTLANTFSISDTNSNTYTTALAPFTNAGSTVQMEIWTANIGTTNASDVITMHVTLTTNAISCVVLQFTNVATSTPVDQVATASYAATTSAITGTTGTTSQANEVLVGCFGATPSSGAGSWVAGSGYIIPTNGTIQGQGHDTTIEYDIVSATGTYQATSTPTNSSTGSGIIITLKQSSTGVSGAGIGGKAGLGGKAGIGI